MSEESSQQVTAPVSGPGVNITAPQATPAADRGPDTHSVLKPLSQHVAPGQEQVDWEARYKGLNEWVGREFNPLREQFTNLSAQLTAITAQLGTQQPQAKETPTPKKETPAPAPAPVSDGNAQLMALDQAIAAKKAAQYRDALIAEYTRPGSPYEGLPLEYFADNIPVHPPSIGNDKIDDSAQREAIVRFADNLKKVRGDAQTQTQKALLEGNTPGAAPGAPPPGQAASDLYAKFTDAMLLMGSEEFDGLSKAEQAKVEETYYSLLESPIIQEMHGGSTRPTRNISEMDRQLQELSKQVAKVLGQNPLGPKMG